MPQIRIAILGVQHYHANFWTNAILQSDKAVIAGVWDSDPALAEEFCRKHRVDIKTELDGLLAQCDAVAICSSTRDHKALIRAAAQKGRAILCEKPLAISVAEGIEIAELVSAANVSFMQSFPKRFDPVTHAVRDIVESGDLGTITLCRVRHGHSHGFDPEFRKAWFVDPELSGGGTLLDEGVHAADFLRFVFGNPDRAFAVLSSSTLDLPVEDTALATFTFANGLIAEVATSWCFAAADASIEIYGTEGTVLVSGVDIASRPTREEGFLQVFKRNGDAGEWVTSELVPHFKTGVFHEHVAWAFINALSEGKAMPAGLIDGLHASAIIEAAYTAARSGQMQDIIYPEYAL